MSARKTIQQAIAIAVKDHGEYTHTGCRPTIGVDKFLEKRLREFFAHEVMTYHKCEDAISLGILDYPMTDMREEIIGLVLNAFFVHIFKDINTAPIEAKESVGPCIHCGAYDGEHDDGCSIPGEAKDFCEATPAERARRMTALCEKLQNVQKKNSGGES